MRSVAVIGSLGPSRYCIPSLLQPGKILSYWERPTVTRTPTIPDQRTDNQFPPMHSLHAIYYSLSFAFIPVFLMIARFFAAHGRSLNGVFW
jgi:hypothetical protein